MNFLHIFTFHRLYILNVVYNNYLHHAYNNNIYVKVTLSDCNEANISLRANYATFLALNLFIGINDQGRFLTDLFLQSKTILTLYSIPASNFSTAVCDANIPIKQPVSAEFPAAAQIMHWCSSEPRLLYLLPSPEACDL